MLGSDLAKLAPPEVELRALSRSDLDITDAPALAGAIDALGPEWVVNAAAYTDVDRAESDYDRALTVNGTAVSELGRLCAHRGIAVLHFSTDYVFRGDRTRPYREDDPTDPVNAYGRSKLAGEEGLLASEARALIIRTQWLYGERGKSFPRTMWERACRRQPTRVVADQHGSPTFTSDVAEVAWRLATRRATGLYHVANAGRTTWFELACVMFATAHAEECLSPCSTVDYPTPARRPAFSVLSADKLEREHGIRMAPWTDALDRFLPSLAAPGLATAPSHLQS